ncbi:MAG: YabP/YqfC family sporulation protein [Oscillospiraceae bacterium]|nr:YabP/YqfC family sporulation protein [Oscillospiraceae bacterium]
MAQELKNKSEATAGERLELEGRRTLRVTGVKEVLHIEEAAVVIQTAEGLLVVHGEGLRLRQLLPQENRVEVLGQVKELRYEQGGSRGGLKKRLFG